MTDVNHFIGVIKPEEIALPVIFIDTTYYIPVSTIANGKFGWASLDFASLKSSGVNVVGVRGGNAVEIQDFSTNPKVKPTGFSGRFGNDAGMYAPTPGAEEFKLKEYTGLESGKLYSGIWYIPKTSSGGNMIAARFPVTIPTDGGSVYRWRGVSDWTKTEKSQMFVTYIPISGFARNSGAECTRTERLSNETFKVFSAWSNRNTSYHRENCYGKNGKGSKNCYTTLTADDGSDGACMPGFGYGNVCNGNTFGGCSDNKKCIWLTDQMHCVSDPPAVEASVPIDVTKPIDSQHSSIVKTTAAGGVDATNTVITADGPSAPVKPETHDSTTGAVVKGSAGSKGAVVALIVLLTLMALGVLMFMLFRK